MKFNKKEDEKKGWHAYRREQGSEKLCSGYRNCFERLRSLETRRNERKTERIGRKKIVGKKYDYISGNVFEPEMAGDGRRDESCHVVKLREGKTMRSSRNFLMYCDISLVRLG